MAKNKKKKNQFESDIVLGETYRHIRSGIEGVAVMVAFFENACERVSLEFYTPEGQALTGKRIHSESFDAVDLVHVETGKQAESEKTGGPDRGEALMRREDITR